jgi:uncharacterized membrane protein
LQKIDNRMISATHFHAMVVHFPIALLTTGFLFELLSLLRGRADFSKIAFYLLLTGTIGAVVSYLAGRQAGAGMEEGELAQAMELHEQAATVALVLAVLTTAFSLYSQGRSLKTGWSKWTGLLLFASVVAAIGLTGYYGGQLVFRHGAGVELALPDFGQ